MESLISLLFLPYLPYGREIELTEYDQKVLDNVDDWIENGIDIDYSKVVYNDGSINERKIMELLLNLNDYADYYNSKNCYNLLEYIITKQFIIDERFKKPFFNYGNFNYTEYIDKPLIFDMIINNAEFSIDLKAKTICIDFVETEEGKELYVQKNAGWVLDEKTGIETWYHGEYALTPERDILKTNGFTWRR